MCLNSGNHSGSLVDVCSLLQMKGSRRGFSYNFWGWFYKNYYLKFIKTCPWPMNCTQLNSLKGWLIKKLPKKRNERCRECVCMMFRRQACCSLSGSHWTHLQPPWRQMFGCWQPSKSVSLGCSFPADMEKVVARQPQRARGSSWDDFPLTLFLLSLFWFFQFLKQVMSQISSANHLIPRAYEWYGEEYGARQHSFAHRSPEVNNCCSKVAKATCFCWQ